VADGVITITYGKDANGAIDAKTLTLTPGVNTNSDVVWVCGNANPPAGSITMSSGSGTRTFWTSTCPLRAALASVATAKR